MHEPNPVHVPSASWVFAPVGAEGRVVEAVVRRLGEAIAFGLVPVGERLPSETDLAARLEVSTVTLREALNILRHNGVVETRRGRGGGTVVRGYGPIAGHDELRENLRGFSADDLRDLTSFACAIGGFAAASAARLAAPSEIDQLRDLAQQAGRATSPRERRRADALFHIQIAAASQSARLTQAEMRIQADFQDLLLLVPDEPRLHRRAKAQHKTIVEAIAARNSEAARGTTELHVQSVSDLVSGLVVGSLER
jgi:GntR family transcriptional regulator, transcriptional repressor for pyruvate dehydrogenase complex